MTLNETLSIPNVLRGSRPDDYFRHTAAIEWPSNAYGRTLVICGDVYRAAVFNTARNVAVAKDFIRFLAPLQDVITDEGDIVVPLDPRYLGLWLTGLFGDPTSSDNGDGSWDHEFASGGEDLPSYTIEVGMPKVPAFFVHAGVKLNSIALEFTRSGPAAATISAIAQGETRFGTTQGGTPTSLTFSRISQFQGSIKRAGDPVGNLTAGAVTYSNNLEKIETIRDDGLIEGADPTIAALTGRTDVRFADPTLIELAADGTPVDLEFAYTLSAQAKLVLTAHEVYLPKPKLAVEGPGGVQASFDFRGAKNDGAGRMLTVTLTNDLDGTVYA
jgi:hypothetical protein